MTDPRDSVFYEPPSYTRQEQARLLPRMLMEGTAALRRERQTWLPPHEAEEMIAPLGGTSDYDIRAGRSVVRPVYSRAVYRDVATLLSKPAVLGEDVPEEIRNPDTGFWQNLDNKGNRGDVFLRDVLVDAIGDAGYSTVLVDHPAMPEFATVADAEALGARPFCRHYRARDVVEPEAEYVNGRERLRRVRLREPPAANGSESMRVLVAAPWDPASRRYIGFVTWEKWERQKTADGGGFVEVMVETGNMAPLTDIPLEPYYVRRSGFFEGSPPYQHLAFLNLRDIQQDSDISEDLRISCGAQLFRSGVQDEEEKQKAIGARRQLYSALEGADAKWLERSGSAAAVYAAYMKESVAEMDRVANEPYSRRVGGGDTATATAVGSTAARSEMEARSLDLVDFVERIFIVFAKYLRRRDGGSVYFPVPPSYISQDLEALRVAMDFSSRTGVPRLETILALMQSQGILPADFSPAREVEMAAAEGRLLPPNGGQSATSGASVTEISAGLVQTNGAQRGRQLGNQSG